MSISYSCYLNAVANQGAVCLPILMPWRNLGKNTRTMLSFTWACWRGWTWSCFCEVDQTHIWPDKSPPATDRPSGEIARPQPARRNNWIAWRTLSDTLPTPSAEKWIWQAAKNKHVQILQRKHFCYQTLAWKQTTSDIGKNVLILVYGLNKSRK